MSAWSGSAQAQEASDWAFHGFADISSKNDYVTPRGLVVTTSGATVQVLDGVVFVSPGGVAFSAGTWSDINPGFSRADGNTTAFNEIDFFAGISANIAPKLEAGAQYVMFVSGQPQNAFKNEHNLEFSLKYHDGDKDAPLTINPYAKFFWAFSSKSSTVVLGKTGRTFDVELGAVPTYTGGGFTISAPTWVTVGPKTYWGAKDNPLAVEGQNFGVASTGLKIAAPFNTIKGSSVYLQAQYYHLINDNLVTAKALLNDGDHKRDHVVFGSGLSMGF